jgi:hypothetical protein
MLTREVRRAFVSLTLSPVTLVASRETALCAEAGAVEAEGTLVAGGTRSEW